MTPRAFILAGGLGTRLRSVVNDRPKALAPVGTTPFLEHQLRYLKAHGIQEFVLCVGYLYEQVRDYFGDGRQWDVSISYSVEHEPLGTAGALKHSEALADGPFLVLNGDTFIDLDISALLAAHRQYAAADDRCVGTLALSQVTDPKDFGLVTLAAERNVIERFHEKAAAVRPPHWVSAGVYVLEPRLFQFIPASQSVSLERETFPQILGSEGRLYGHPIEASFIDIGTPEGYRRFQEYAGGVLS